MPSQNLDALRAWLTALGERRVRFTISLTGLAAEGIAGLSVYATQDIIKTEAGSRLACILEGLDSLLKDTEQN